MLVLSRKTGEEIVIGNNIVVKVTRIRGDKVRIAIEAPPDVRIMRSELTPRPGPSPQPSPRSAESE